MLADLQSCRVTADPPSRIHDTPPLDSTVALPSHISGAAVGGLFVRVVQKVIGLTLREHVRHLLPHLGLLLLPQVLTGHALKALREQCPCYLRHSIAAAGTQIHQAAVTVLVVVSTVLHCIPIAVKAVPIVGHWQLTVLVFRLPARP